MDTSEHHEHELHVIVFSLRTPEPKEFTWEPTMTIGAAATAAASAFGYEPGNFGLETTGEHGHVLENNKTLEGEQIHDGEKLELISTGGGVHG